MDEKKRSCSDWCVQLMGWVMNVCIFVLVFIFPLIFNDAYYDIPEVKYQCYYLSILVSLGIIAILAVILMLADKKETDGRRIRGFFNSLRPCNWRKTLRKADIAILIFWLAVVISTFQSDYFYESVWGNEGRYSGLFLLSVYVVAYFMISRLWHFKSWSMQIFLISGMIMCLIGIGDYFQLDLLRLRNGFKPVKSEIFTSTIGNINIYTAYVALLMGFATAMFVQEKNKLKKIWYYVCMLVSFFAIIMGCSDNAYLALTALFALLPFVLFQNLNGVKNYLIVAASFLSAIQCIVWLNIRYADMVIGLDSLFKVIASFAGLPVLIGILWIVAGFCWIVEKKNAFHYQSVSRAFLYAWCALLAIGFFGVCFALVDANVLGHAERYQSLGNYLIFNDSWGTERGYIWKKSMELYKKFPLIRKLFGYGPETFGILTITTIQEDMVAKTGVIYDNAHNEYLQYLVTLGAVGLVTYLIFLFSVFRNMYKKRNISPYLLGFLGAVACYSAQALVNLNLPMVAPTMWMMLSMGMSVCFDDKET